MTSTHVPISDAFSPVVQVILERIGTVDGEPHFRCGAVTAHHAGIDIDRRRRQIDEFRENLQGKLG
jgi:hypothetical protein